MEGPSACRWDLIANQRGRHPNLPNTFTVTVRVLLSINPNTAPPARRKSVVVLEEQEPSLWSSLVWMVEVQ